MNLTKLTDRAVLAVSGPGSRTFLQGLITNDIGKLAPDAALYAALLTPQGKILFDFFLYEKEGVVLLDCAAAVSDALQKRLTLYRLRAKVEIAPRHDLHVVASTDETVAGGWRDPRLPALGWRAIGATDHASPLERYTSHRLDLGVPEGTDFGQDKMFALDADLEELHGVAFDKGCYVGQELTARMKHRGTARKRLIPVVSEGADLPGPDTPVLAAGREIGTLTSVYQKRGFALMRIDRLDEASGTPLTAADVPTHVTKPAWLFP
jgi:tRNA-modifying protein YgfZ